MLNGIEIMDLSHCLCKDLIRSLTSCAWVTLMVSEERFKLVIDNVHYLE